MRTPTSNGISSKRFAVLFVSLLVILLLAFIGMVRWAAATLPQQDEVVSVEEAAELLAANQIEHILIQGERDVFLYRSEQPRPLYMRLALTQTFTETMTAAGVPVHTFPPIEAEEE